VLGEGGKPSRGDGLWGASPTEAKLQGPLLPQLAIQLVLYVAKERPPTGERIPKGPGIQESIVPSSFSSLDTPGLRSFRPNVENSYSLTPYAILLALREHGTPLGAGGRTDTPLAFCGRKPRDGRRPHAPKSPSMQLQSHGIPGSCLLTRGWLVGTLSWATGIGDEPLRGQARHRIQRRALDPALRGAVLLSSRRRDVQVRTTGSTGLSALISYLVRREGRLPL
jgi:hypothetical protein